MDNTGSFSIQFVSDETGDNDDSVEFVKLAASLLKASAAEPVGWFEFIFEWLNFFCSYCVQPYTAHARAAITTTKSAT